MSIIFYLSIPSLKSHFSIFKLKTSNRKAPFSAVIIFIVANVKAIILFLL